jgi:hypothetical protein
MSDFDDFALHEQPRLRTKADVDVEVAELSQERRLAMAARRAADLFDYCSMYSTASLLRELAHAADFELNTASAILEAEPE